MIYICDYTTETAKATGKIAHRVHARMEDEEARKEVKILRNYHNDAAKEPRYQRGAKEPEVLNLKVP